MSQRFRKKPVVIEAIQFDGTNLVEVKTFLGMDFKGHNGVDHPLLIRTLEGTMTVRKGDWVIRGVKGEFYPCKPDIFEATYDALDDGPANGGSDG